jgi:hypothetical protein
MGAINKFINYWFKRILMEFYNLIKIGLQQKDKLIKIFYFFF